jgi:hypothetical protein
MPPRARAALLICLAAVVPYLPALDDYFVQDDFGVVALLSQKPASAFPRWFVSTWMDDIWGYTPDEIRPFPAVSYQVAAWWGAASPVANHVMNIALHAANALLVLAIGIEAAGLGLVAATCAAVVFALLPIHPETVAWVTGRVDSMPAFFYLAAFLAYVRWRATGASRLYLAALGLFFVALFSKQNTVTLPVALAGYDVIVSAPGWRLSWARVRPWLPFVVLTAAYLLLRYLVFGEVARESLLTSQNLDYFFQLSSRHVARLVAGRVVPLTVVAAALAAAIAVIAVVSFLSSLDRRRTARAGVYFLVIWTMLGIAPTLVAGYESDRHIYLASAGWAIATGLAIDVLWHARPRRIMRPMAAMAIVLVTAVYGLQLAIALRDWGARVAVSELAAHDLEREALAAPEGSLLIVDAPVGSWEWALPFAARPPFTASDLTSRVNIVSTRLLHCCREQWHEDTRRVLARWAAHPERPIIALHWDHEGASRLTDREDPFLRSLMTALVETQGPDALQGGLRGAIEAAKAAR